MLEPMALVALVEAQFQPKLAQDLRILITAGPTCEAIDPVRYLTNQSSGKMGYALAQAAILQGAQVTLISGPVNLSAPAGARLVKVTSGLEMYDAVHQHVPQCDIFISCAAVADFRPKDVALQKMKKQSDCDEMTLTLVKNPDIVASVAALSEHRPFTVGFAAETQNVAEYAQQKLYRKGLDLICANDVSDPSQGFNADENALHLFWPQGEQILKKTDKTQLAATVIATICRLKQSDHLETDA